MQPFNSLRLDNLTLGSQLDTSINLEPNSIVGVNSGGLALFCKDWQSGNALIFFNLIVKDRMTPT